MQERARKSWGRYLSVCITIAAMLSMAALSVRGQLPSATTARESVTTAPEYEVVSVRPNHTGGTGMQFRTTTDTLQATNITLQMLVGNAYGVSRLDLIYGLPGWGETERFDMEAKIDSSSMPPLSKLGNTEKQAMLQKVLADRFGLKAHWEQKDMAIYQLLVGKDGPKFKETSTESAQGKEFAASHMGTDSMMVNNGRMKAYGMTMKSLSGYITQELHRNVIDKTGLDGHYDFTLKWASNDPNAHDLEDRPPMMTALQEQLGLKLQPARGIVETLVVDHAEEPSEN